mmetsp:Transcript_11570/g.32101  ORF Transcript_11570/g.32101 Transcript_11570/m.32101 type:complete len:511 (-) Transcript_11570:91-1623(-)
MRFADSACSQDVKYLLDNIIRRTKGLEDWLMVLKAVTVLHRIYRETRSTEVKKKVAHWSRYHLASLKNYKDGSTPQALDMSAFVRTYSLYLYEKFETLAEMEFDPALEDTSAPSKTREMSAVDLCEKFPKLQTVMYRAVGCKPQGVACQNNVVLFSFLMVVTESMKIYRATNDGVLNMLDKFFETDVVVAQQLFDMYKLSLQHAEELQELYQFSKSLAFGSTMEFPKLEQPPASFLETMTEYIADLRKTGKSEHTKKKAAEAQPQIDTGVDLLDFSEPVPAAAPAPAPAPAAGSNGFENNAAFGDNADFLAAPGSEAPKEDGTSPGQNQSPSSGGINLDALYGLNAGAASSAPQSATVFGGVNQQMQQPQQMAGSPMMGGAAAAGMAMMQQMMQQPQMMQQMMMQQQQAAGMGQQPPVNAFGANQMGMGMAAAPQMQQAQFAGSPNGGGAMQQQPMGGTNGFAPSGGNPFAAAPATSPSQNAQFNNLFSPNQQQQKPQQNSQSPSFDFLT